ncbi:uncharacterized protein B0H18DRAFT_558683 [Fomitopsis serialis]|uniref:uncharacterized protein n=1 Tax=Fomitopsis serialis TaxID=139415 RepID=UPI002008522C|nr:uncharacterized protein B0H18DRAFT_558683 [Neoantrodia serialis]KAH9921388.1 hypothetical protein B0H18DRAFT_558683 [Neoantrodia serialis]
MERRMPWYRRLTGGRVRRSIGVGECVPAVAQLTTPAVQQRGFRAVARGRALSWCFKSGCWSRLKAAVGNWTVRSTGVVVASQKSQDWVLDWGVEANRRDNPRPRGVAEASEKALRPGIWVRGDIMVYRCALGFEFVVRVQVSKKRAKEKNSSKTKAQNSVRVPSSSALIFAFQFQDSSSTSRLGTVCCSRPGRRPGPGPGPGGRRSSIANGSGGVLTRESCPELPPAYIPRISFESHP